MNRCPHALAVSLVCASGMVLAHGDEDPAAVAAGKFAAHDHHGHDDAAIGVAGKASNVTRTVKVDMTDTMRFIPSSISARQGETIRFIVKNSGQVKHEFVMGTDKELKQHYELMKKFPEMGHADPNQVTVAPGKTGEVIWQFTKAGKVDFACLQPGHFDAGMKGIISVSHAQSTSSSVTDSEVHKVDNESKKIKLKQGETKKLQMPGMTSAMALQSAEATSNAAGLIEIKWNEANNFERAIDVAPAGFAELCVKLPKGQLIAWSFKAAQPLDFNIHFHEGENVVSPVTQAQVAALDGELNVAVDQDYCWMWQNKSATKADLRVELHRH